MAVTLDDEISTLEREVLGEPVQDEEEVVLSVANETKVIYDEINKPNQQYVYGEEGGQKQTISPQKVCVFNGSLVGLLL